MEYVRGLLFVIRSFFAPLPQRSLFSILWRAGSEAGRKSRSSQEGLSIEASVLDRFGDVGGRDAVAPVEVGDGPRDLQNPVVRAGREAECLFI